MPTFSSKGNDEYICQRCARIFDSVDCPCERLPIPGRADGGDGNVCPDCQRRFYAAKPAPVSAEDSRWIWAAFTSSGELMADGLPSRADAVDAAQQWQNARGLSESFIVRKRPRTSPGPMASAEYRGGRFRQESGPISVYEHCREESGGLTGRALDNYVNRYYGHG
jgi:DNA-directed RNA polymerase subunit RPC12/RpoP